MAPRTLVTGAGGRLGREVTQLLAASGHELVALVLTQQEADEVARFTSAIHVGPAHDARLARTAVEGVDAVVHLAAIPAPTLDEGPVVFGHNTLATYCVLEAAGEAGVPTAVIASSIAATGLSFSPSRAHPAWLPIDVDLPTQAADPYALSKVTDEATAAMMNRRYGTTLTALRFPFLGLPDDRLPARAQQLAEHPEKGLGDLWSYLDTRDAARAVQLALGRDGGDLLVVGVAAPDNLSPYPSEQLLDRFMPEVPRRQAFPGRSTLIDLTGAETMLGFRAEHLWPVDPRDLKEQP